MTPKPRRTKAQHEQWRLRSALGALSMLPTKSPTVEYTEDWKELIACRDRILARIKLQSKISHLRTRAGNLRYPAWDSDEGHDHAFIRGWSLCGLAWHMTPRVGTADEQPRADETSDRVCPLCLDVARIAGVLKGSEDTP